MKNLHDCIRDMMGILDNPIMRRKMKGDMFYHAAVTEGREILGMAPEEETVESLRADRDRLLEAAKGTNNYLKRLEGAEKQDLLQEAIADR